MDIIGDREKRGLGEIEEAESCWCQFKREGVLTMDEQNGVGPHSGVALSHQKE